MVDVENFGKFKPVGKQKVKKQIILCHTSREVEEYLTSLSFRYNGKYDKIPNYVITRRGKVLQLLPNVGHSNFFKEDNVNRNSVIICLENLGWLEKKPLKNYYINWKGSIYNEQVFEKKWRDYFFWQPYTTSQIQATAELCKMVSQDLKIRKKSIGYNTKIDGINLFEGIVSRSNFNTMFTDLNPSFNFQEFEKLLNDE